MPHNTLRVCTTDPTHRVRTQSCAWWHSRRRRGVAQPMHDCTAHLTVSTAVTPVCWVPNGRSSQPRFAAPARTSCIHAPMLVVATPLT